MRVENAYVNKTYMDFARTIPHALHHILGVQISTSYVCNAIIHTQTISFNTGYSFSFVIFPIVIAIIVAGIGFYC